MSITKSQSVLLSFLTEAFEAIGGVPHQILTDNMKTIKDEARTEHRAGKVNVKFAAYAADFGFHVKPCIAWRPRTKVLIGRIQGPVPLVVIGDLSGQVRLMILDLHSSKLNLPVHMSQDLIKHLALT